VLISVEVVRQYKTENSFSFLDCKTNSLLHLQMTRSHESGREREREENRSVA